MEAKKLTKNLIMILLCTTLNIILRKVAAALVLPFWLDAVGTIICAIMQGPIGGAICGLLTNVIIGFGQAESFAYALVSIGIGVSIGYFYPKTPKPNAFAVISTAVFAGLVAVVLSTPLNMFFYGGRTGNIWGDGLIDMISRDVNIPIVCTILGEAFVDLPDKALSVFMAIGIIRLYRKVVDRRGTTTMVSIFAILIFASFGIDAKANNLDADYSPVVYDTDEGLATVEINTLAQTADGYVWAGTYAGLYRCDGSRFEEVILDERISNVIQLYVDSRDYLWIGTNDSGLARYDIYTKEVKFYDFTAGGASNSIRTISEDDKGNIFVGTATKLCMIDGKGNLHVFKEEQIYGVRSMSCNDGIVAGVTNAGDLFFIRDKNIIGKIQNDEDSIYYAAVAAGDNGLFMVGTTENSIYQVRLDDDKIIIGHKYLVGDSKYFNKIYYSQENGGYFYCCEVGKGFITEEGARNELSVDGINNSIADVMTDYQGNIWFASDKQGIVRYSKNPFQDVFARAKVDPDIVNSLLIKNRFLYVGTNSGLITIDLKTYYSVPIEHPELFQDVRVRDIMEDSKGNLWVSTYGKNGLVEMQEDGDVVCYNERTKGTEGGRFRLAMELSDGSIAAATSTGLNFIQNEVVTKTMGEEDGISTQFLSMVETNDGDILAGSDGDGIYRIRDGEIVEHYTENQGLDSLVVLKIVPCGDDDYIFVTSNALYYYKNDAITKLNNFPYRNNYDVFFSDDGDAWITSSAGIFVVGKKELIENGDYNFSVLNKSRGLYSSLSANSKYAFDGSYLYLCCSDGVRRIPVDTDEFFNNDYDIRISNLIAGDHTVEPREDGTYVIDATSGHIRFDVAVLNFTLSNPLLHIYLEGADDDGIICLQKDMQSLSYLNLPYGEYKLHVDVMGVAGNEVVRNETFNVVKESQIFERMYFKVYLFVVCMLFVIFIGWLIGNIRAGITSLERWQKEAKIDPMTGFWNKVFSQQELTIICRENKGILMMLDLDNFKLINDIYGHDTGDKVLVSFAKIVRSCIRDNDFAGRFGGDEFIVFIQGTSEESAVAEKARYLNEEILRVCEDTVGDDFDIPIGVSIGAVLVPDEGTDFNELFRKADKALYTVKQDGKHGYSMYKNFEPTLGSGDEVGVSDLAGLRMILGERGDSRGAYLVDFDKLQMVYRLFVRMSKRTFVNVWIVQFKVEKADGGEVEPEIIDKFVGVLSLNLRSNDVVAPNGNNKVIVIMTDTSSRNGQTPVERIMKKWKEAAGDSGYVLTYETEDM
ncbi:MAG: diguanylate cyclase [Butyrivibrio sp.]|nr:diguanylate cyclase [Butyrivibrio sp.]